MYVPLLTMRHKPYKTFMHSKKSWHENFIFMHGTFLSSMHGNKIFVQQIFLHETFRTGKGRFGRLMGLISPYAEGRMSLKCLDDNWRHLVLHHFLKTCQ